MYNTIDLLSGLILLAVIWNFSIRRSLTTHIFHLPREKYPVFPFSNFAACNFSLQHVTFQALRGSATQVFSVRLPR